MTITVRMNNEVLEVSVTGIVVTINTENMVEGLTTLTKFLGNILPEDAKAHMLEDMEKVEKIIELLARYRSCFHYNNNQILEQTITLNEDGTIHTSWEKCSATIDFKEMLKVIQDFQELTSGKQEIAKSPGDVSPEEDYPILFNSAPTVIEVCNRMNLQLRSYGIDKHITNNEVLEVLKSGKRGTYYDLDLVLTKPEIVRLFDHYGFKAELNY